MVSPPIEIWGQRGLSISEVFAKALIQEVVILLGLLQNHVLVCLIFNSEQHLLHAILQNSELGFSFVLSL